MSPTYRYNIVANSEGESTVTITDNGVVTHVDQDHPRFAAIAKALLAGEDPYPLLAIDEIEMADPRITVTADGALQWCGREVHGQVAKAVERYKKESRDPSGLVKFLERLDQNPSERSKCDLFKWLEAQKLFVDKDGYVLAYKGVQRDRKSASSGYGIVDGREFQNAQLSNHDGAVVEMPREKVTDNPSVACGTGLHVGSFSYARGFSQLLVEVRVDPKDVVSVPTDSHCQKMRVCRYEVIGVHGEDRGDDLTHLEADDNSWTPEQAEEALEEAIPRKFLDRLLGRRREKRGR